MQYCVISERAPPVGSRHKELLSTTLPGSVRACHQLFSNESTFLEDFMLGQVGGSRVCGGEKGRRARGARGAWRRGRRGRRRRLRRQSEGWEGSEA